MSEHYKMFAIANTLSALGHATGITYVAQQLNRTVKAVLPRPQQRRTLLTRPRTSLPVDDLIQAAIMSRLAYEDPAGLRAAAKQPVGGAMLRQDVLDAITESNPAFVDGTSNGQDAQAYVWRLPDGAAAVVFRGTSSAADAASDLDVRTHDVGHGVHVHQGFFLQLMSVEDQIARLLNEKEGFTRLDVQGHSLGAACATLAALHFKNAFPGVPVRCTTFGSPRVGNWAFAQRFDGRIDETFRCFNEEDPVPMVPMSHRFQHVGRGVCIDDANLCYKVDKDLAWWCRPYACAATVDYFNPIGDHDCALYVQRLAALKENEQ